MDDIRTVSRSKSPPTDRASISALIEQFVREIIGEDTADLLDVNEQSSFVGDLEMDSIQIVHLAERINECYGKQVDFIGWLSAKSIRDLLDLTVDDVATFIEENI
jgi:acyl carrier protein